MMKNIEKMEARDVLDWRRMDSIQELKIIRDVDSVEQSQTTPRVKYSLVNFEVSEKSLLNLTYPNLSLM